MMNRRDFLKAGAGIAGAMAFGFNPLAYARPVSALRLTILHTNDVHSHIDPAASGEFIGLGGVAARSAMIKDIRSREPNVLLFDAGDIFQGTPYFNLFQGEPEIKAMNAMGYNASAIGNHDFDGGILRLAELARDTARFPFLNCNYSFMNTPMQGLAREYMTMESEGMRIGILGVGIKLDGLVPARLYGETLYLDPIAHAKRVAEVLRHDEKCDFIICLSHINLRAREEFSRESEPGDRDLLREVPEIDLVIGGHNHFLLPRPEGFFRHEEGTIGYAVQSGWAGTHLGFLQFDLYGKQQRELSSARTLGISTLPVSNETA